MPYSKFTLDLIEKRFGIENQVVNLFSKSEKLAPSERLIEALQTAQELPVRSEKAKSETIVFPILVELRNRNDKFFTIYSGDNLNVDESLELEGECDFILAKETGSFNINYPIFQLLEAKKNDTDLGVPQCAAQMIGARLFNEQKGIKLDNIYGCVTTGKDWIFMLLSDKLYIDKRTYYLENIEELLGVFQQIINYYKQTINQ
jgi:hypothetical protein